MTEEEAREIVERYEALLSYIAGPQASTCELPIYFSEGHVHVSETTWAEWPCTRVLRRNEMLFTG